MLGGMSIRAQILLIVSSALLLAFAVSTLAYLDVREFDSDLEAILEEQLPMVQAVTGVRRGVMRVEEAESRMLASDDVSHMRSVEVALADVGVHVRKGVELPAGKAQAERWLQIGRLVGELRFQEHGIEGLINTEVREIQGLQRRLAPRLSRMRSGLVRMRSRFELAEAVKGGLAPADMTRLEHSAREAERALAVLERLRYSAGQTDLYTHDVHRNIIAHHLDSLRRHLSQLDAGLGTTPWAGRQAEVSGEFAEVSSQLEEAERRILDVNQRLLAAREETQLTRDRIGRLATTIQSQEWQSIASSRAETMEKRKASGRTMLLLLLGGLLFVSALAFAVLRRLTQSIGRLLRASRRWRKGDLGVQVKVGGRHELAELGVSFNSMARYLQERRDQQNHYNCIVTKLNSSLGVEDTLQVSLRDIVVRTGSELGAIYLSDQQSDGLDLAHSYGLGASRSRRTRVEIGEGLVGEVASSRRVVVVDPVPPGVFDMDVGVAVGPPRSLLVLPLVHLDTLLGVIVLGSARSFSKDEVTFIEEVVFQLAVALRNARFYQTIESTAGALRDANVRLRDEQEALEDANQKLAEGNRLKSEFLANVTHELRTPLNSIIGYTELVLDDEVVVDENRRLLGTSLRNARNLLRLINDLLEVSRMEAGAVSLTVERFDPLRLIQDVVELAEPLLAGKPVEITTRLPDELPLMNSDRGKCKQILVNLLSNAIKFTDTGTVVISAEVEETMLVVNVRDSGIGIRPEDLEVVFDKFRQLDGSSSRRFGGAGLGLAITRQLCDFLGGKVSAASVVGEGSTFAVRLPMSLGDISQEMMPAVAAPQEDGGRPFVLVIDNDPTSVVNLREGLDGTGIDVRIAFTARDAADILAGFDPVAVVIGTALPEGGGAETIGDVMGRIKRAELPMLLVSGPGGEVESGGDQADAVMGVVSRPLEAGEVLGMLLAAGVEGLPEPTGDCAEGVQ
jgi:signal transduction histidine kinase